MDRDSLKEEFKKIEKDEIIGWDFSKTNNYIVEEEIPWNYKDIINKYRKDGDILLDMGTGGGEFLISLNHPYNNTYITESYEPNIKLCKERLESLGINVNPINDDSNLPFKDNFFFIIINIHESYDIKEVKRILKPKGIFITQQVDYRDILSLSKKINKDFKTLFPDANMEKHLKNMNENGFEIIYNDEAFLDLKFLDIKAIIFYATSIPWSFPDFSVENKFNELLDIYTEINEKGYIKTEQGRFIIVGKKG